MRKSTVSGFKLYNRKVIEWICHSPIQINDGYYSCIEELLILKLLLDKELNILELPHPAIYSNQLLPWKGNYYNNENYIDRNKRFMILANVVTNFYQNFMIYKVRQDNKAD